MHTEALLEFVAASWPPEAAYKAPEIGRIFDTDRANARYYLNRLTNKGHLTRIRYEHNVWFILPKHEPLFNEFVWIGVIIN